MNWFLVQLDLQLAFKTIILLLFKVLNRTNINVFWEAAELKARNRWSCQTASIRPFIYWQQGPEKKLQNHRCTFYIFNLLQSVSFLFLISLDTKSLAACAQCRTDARTHRIRTLLHRELQPGADGSTRGLHLSCLFWLKKHLVGREVCHLHLCGHSVNCRENTEKTKKTDPGPKPEQNPQWTGWHVMDQTEGGGQPPEKEMFKWSSKHGRVRRSPVNLAT